MKDGHDEGHNKSNPENRRMFESVCFSFQVESGIVTQHLDFMKEHYKSTVAGFTPHYKEFDFFRRQTLI